MKLGKEAEALSSFQNAIRLDPSKAGIWQQVLVMEYQKQDFETLYKDGKNAILVNKEDHLMMGAAIKELIDNADFTNKLVIEARKKSEQYDWKIVKHQWISVLQ